MIYITGDTHGKFKRIQEFCELKNTTTRDTLIILGDVGINYYGPTKGDIKLKRKLRSLPITIFALKGNHDNYAGNIDTYQTKIFANGEVLIEPEYPNLVFAKDGEVYHIDNLKYLVIGGAYSVDKFYRLTTGKHWFADEQPDEQVKLKVEEQLRLHNHRFDIVLTHTCPYSYIPRETFLPNIDQSTVDVTTELWLDDIEKKIQYDKWYCGHYHTNKLIDKIRFMFEDILVLG